MALVGAWGVAATAILAAKGVKKAEEARKEAQEANGQEPLTEAETVMAEAPAYLPAVLSGAATIACIFGANICNKRQQAMLISAYAALESNFIKYRKQVDSLCGPGTDELIRETLRRRDEDDDDPPWDRIETFYIDGLDRPVFFERTTEEVMRAIYNLNRNFILKGYSTLNEFLEYLRLEPENNGNIGWDQCDGEMFYGYRWIDVNRVWRTMDDGLRVCSLEFPFMPHVIR